LGDGSTKQELVNPFPREDVLLLMVGKQYSKPLHRLQRSVQKVFNARSTS
jgi:hypothetical protein